MAIRYVATLDAVSVIRLLRNALLGIIPLGWEMSDIEPPDLPVATVEPPTIAGITILSSHDAGSMNIWVFKINHGEEDAAINGLLDSLNEMTTFSLADHSRDDYESCATYEKDGGRFRMFVGGHGWSGGWQSLDRAAAIAEARKQMRYNYGTASHECGQLTKRK